MANILAAQNGNFNATTTWIGGVVPGVGDVAYANTRTVTITANVTCDKLSTRGDNGATAGGGFTVAAGSTGLTVTAAIEAGTTTCLTSNLISGQTLTVDASVGGIVGGSADIAFGVVNAVAGTLAITGNCTGGSGSSAHGVQNSSSGTITITGNCTGGSGNSTFAANNNSTGTLTITGNCTGGSATSTLGVNNNSTGTLTITGNCTGGSAGNAHGAFNTSTGTLTITGNCTGGSVGNANGAFNNSTGTLTITGIAYASALAQGALNNSAGVLRVVRAVGNGFGLGVTGVSNVVAVTSNTTGSLTYVQEIEFGSLGNTPVSGPILLTDVTSNAASFYKEGGGRKTLVDTNATAGVLPATSDVRSGVVYSTGSLTGTLAVPPAESVLFGVPVDNTTGTVAITTESIASALAAASAITLDQPTNTLNTPGSIGERLKLASTVATTAQQLSDALSNE